MGRKIGRREKYKAIGIFEYVFLFSRVGMHIMSLLSWELQIINCTRGPQFQYHIRLKEWKTFTDEVLNFSVLCVFLYQTM